MTRDRLTVSPDDAGEPPRPPKAARALRLRRSQALGLLLVALPAVLALANLFGMAERRVGIRGGGVEVRVEHPTRIRHKQSDALAISVTNRLARTLDTVDVSVDTAYLNRFSDVTMVPSADEPWRTGLADVAPGETRLVLVELQAEEYWRHDGTVRVSAGGPDTLAVAVGTFVYP